jgi:hypothetical protein
MLLFAGNASAQYIGALANYSLNANGNDIVRDIGVTETFSKITVGSYQPSGSTYYNGFILSDQTNNNYDWRVIIGGSGNDEVNAVDVRRVWNGTEYVEEIYVTGYFTGTVTFTRYVWYPIGYIDEFFTMNSPYGSSDCTYFVAKLNRLGGLMWIQYSGNTSEWNTEIGNDVDVCVVGSEVQVYTTGFFRGNPYFYQGSTPTTQVHSATSWNSVFTNKYIDNGSSATLSWVRTVNDATNNQHDYGYGVCGDGSGNVYMCGSIGNNAVVGTNTLTVVGNDEAIAVKYNSSGTPQWSQAFGGNGTIQTPSDQARCITFRGSSLYVSGYFSGGGGLFPQGTNTSVDAFVMKMGTDGSIGWRDVVQNTAGTDLVYKHSISIDGSKIFAVGSMAGDAHIYCMSLSSSGTIPSVNGGAYINGFFVAFNTSDGSLFDHEWVGGYDNTSVLTTVETYQDDHVLFGGTYKDHYLYESGNNYMLTNSNTVSYYNDGILGMYIPDPYRMQHPGLTDEQPEAHTSGMDLRAFPNPVHTSVTVTKSTDAAAQVDVLDLAGRSVIETTLMTGMQTILDLSSLGTGMYLVRVTEGSRSEVIRITKQ